jgi:hypothetical protein
MSVKIPSVLQQELVNIRARDMLPLFQTYRHRLERTRGSHIVATVERLLGDVQRAHRYESSLRAEIDSLESNIPFRESWKMLEGKLPDLVDIVGGLATVFRWSQTFLSLDGKSIHRSALTEFLLEDLLYARQLDRLRALPSE